MVAVAAGLLQAAVAHAAAPLYASGFDTSKYGYASGFATSKYGYASGFDTSAQRKDAQRRAAAAVSAELAARPRLVLGALASGVNGRRALDRWRADARKAKHAREAERDVRSRRRSRGMRRMLEAVEVDAFEARIERLGLHATQRTPLRHWRLHTSRCADARAADAARERAVGRDGRVRVEEPLARDAHAVERQLRVVHAVAPHLVAHVVDRDAAAGEHRRVVADADLW